MGKKLLGLSVVMLFSSGLALYTGTKSQVNASDSVVYPKEKSGYRMIFDDSFDGSTLNQSKWVDSYLPHWASDPTLAKANYTIEDGSLKLKLNQDAVPWSPFDKEVRVSSLMTAEKNGIHNFTENNEVLSPQAEKVTNLTRYGYFEIRAKMQKGGGIHTAWWMTGWEDTPKETGELDLFEILGRNVNQITSTKHPWKDTDITYVTTKYTPKNVDLSSEYHTYAFSWDKNTMKFYFDGTEYKSMANDINYPLMMFISLYENRGSTAWTGPFDPTIPYPKSLDVDYMRIYKKIPTGSTAVDALDLKVVSQDQQIYNIPVKNMEIKDGKITGTPSWVSLNYNDGTDTQESVVWDKLTTAQINKLKTSSSEVKIPGRLTTTTLSDKFKATPVELTIRSSADFDKTDLVSAIDESAKLNKDDYTSVSWANMQTALEQANSVNNNAAASQTDVDNALAQLTSAQNALVGKETDKSVLKKVIEESERKAQNNYTTASWLAFTTVLQQAKVVENNNNALQSEIDAATTLLNNAINQLVVNINTAELTALIAMTVDLKQGDYTDASWLNMRLALVAAQQIVTNTNASQSDVDAAYTRLKVALAALVSSNSGIISLDEDAYVSAKSGAVIWQNASVNSGQILAAETWLHLTAKQLLSDGRLMYQLDNSQHWVAANDITISKVIITKISGVVNVEKERGTLVYANPDGTNATLQKLSQHTKWQVFAKATSKDGTIFYNVGSEQWISSNDVAFEDAGHIIITPLNKIGKVFYLPGYAINVWETASGEKFTGQRLNHGTTWKLNSVAKQTNGKQYYNVGKNQWVDAKYIQIIDQQPIILNAIGTIQYQPGFGINLWNGYGENKEFSGKRLPHQSKWRVTAKIIVNNHIWYQVGKNQWVDGNYMKLS